MLIVRGVNVFPSQIEELILRTAGLSPHYWLEMARAGHLDTLTVHVECGGDVSDEGSRSRAAAELASHVKAFVGISVAVEIHAPGSIERSTGKAKRLRDGRRP